MDRQGSVRTLIDRTFQSIGYFPVPAYDVTCMSTAVGMVKAWLGVTFLPSSALEVSELSGVRSRVLNHPALTRKIVVAQKTGRSLSPAAQAFLRSLVATSRSLMMPAED